MPIYEYRCKECHQVFEDYVTQINDAETAICPVCDSAAERIISNTSFVLKGEGWYVTEYGYKSKEGKTAPDAAAQAAPAASAPAASAPAAPAPAPQAAAASSGTA